MAKITDHDLLIGIDKDIKYITRDIKRNRICIKWLKDENQVRKDWQETWDTKTKVYMAVASAVGGIIVFVVDKVWAFFSQKAN